MPGDGINYGVTPNWDLYFPAISDVVHIAASYFIKRARIRFLIIKSPRTQMFFVMPWHQYRSLTKEHPCFGATPFFDGYYDDLRQLANAFPPDLFRQPATHEQEDSCQSQSEKSSASDDLSQ